MRLFTGYDGEGKRQYKNKTVVGTKKKMPRMHLPSYVPNIPKGSSPAGPTRQ